MSVSMWEGSSFDILARNSDFVTFLNEWWEGKGFGSSPVNSFSSFKTVYSLLENFLYQSMESFVFWKCWNFDSNFSYFICVDSSLLSFIFRKLFDFTPFFSFPVLNFKRMVFAQCISLFHFIYNILLVLVNKLLIKNSLVNQEFLVNSSNRCHLSNSCVHNWVGEHWLIQLVVSKLSITN